MNVYVIKVRDCLNLRRNLPEDGVVKYAMLTDRSQGTVQRAINEATELARIGFEQRHGMPLVGHPRLIDIVTELRLMDYTVVATGHNTWNGVFHVDCANGTVPPADRRS